MPLDIFDGLELSLQDRLDLSDDFKGFVVGEVKKQLRELTVNALIKEATAKINKSTEQEIDRLQKIIDKKGDVFDELTDEELFKAKEKIEKLNSQLLDLKNTFSTQYKKSITDLKEEETRLLEKMQKKYDELKTNFINNRPRYEFGGFPIQGLIESFGFSLDGGGSAVVSGSTRVITIPYDCVIKTWTLLADQSGSAVIDIKRSTYANYASPVSMVGSGNKPTLTSQTQNTAIPTSWTSTRIIAGDIIHFVNDSASTVTWLNLVLTVSKI